MGESKVVRWGILGAGNIAHRFARSLAQVEGAELVALSCRSADKAHAFADEFGVGEEGVYCDELLGAPDAGHAALLSNPDVDAVYLCLPHALHHDWAVRALRGGKAVLCEKPACLTADEMTDVARVAHETDGLFMEAQKARFTPCYQAVRAAVEAGEIGEVVRVETSLCNDMADLIASGATYHSRPVGGGVLLDCGTYCASWLDDFLPAGDPAVTDFAGIANADGIDMYADAHLTIGDKEATLECAFDRAKPRRATLVGTRGRIVVDELHRCQHATVFADGGETREIDVPYEVDDFYGEVRHFTDLVIAGARESGVMPLASSLRCAQIIDAVKARYRLDAVALDELESQERSLAWDGPFTSRDALRLGNAAARIAPEYDRGVTVRVVRESDGLVMFEWATDDKAPRNQVFAEGKAHAVRMCGHSSLWAWVAHEVNGSCQEVFAYAAPEKYGTSDFACPAAGALPIRGTDGSLLATLAVSGLHEGRDHELAVRALAEVEGKNYSTDVPAYTWLAK